MVTTAEYSAYKTKHLTAIKKLITSCGVRPVLFLGCGITKRYLGSPSWMELLKEVSSIAGMNDDQFNFLSQKAGAKPAALGSLLVDVIHEWAWSKGRNKFPVNYFEAGKDKSIFLKHLCAEFLKGFEDVRVDGNFKNEISLLKKTDPHAIITTNFDNFIDKNFPDSLIVVGEKIIPMTLNIIGELYKIHGSVDDPLSMVLTQEDYDRFIKKRRYISSKILTYFAEYPVFIIGYGLGDPNVNCIISDLGEALMEEGGFMSNVYYVEWVPEIEKVVHLKEEHLVPAEEGVSPVRVNTIITSDFEWLLKALSDYSSPVKINKKTLRGLASRVVDFVRMDAPKTKIEFDYAKIENLSNEDGELGMLLGIQHAPNANADYPYILSQVAQKLGFQTWNKLQKFIIIANEELGYDVKSEDGKYHFGFKAGKKQITHKYSEEFVGFMREVIKKNK